MDTKSNSLKCNNKNLNTSAWNFTRETGTPLYTAPEQERNLFYNDKSDVYTMGLLLYEMLGKFKTIHMKVDRIRKLKQESKIDEAFEKRYPHEARLIRRLCEQENSRRPKCAEIKQLPEYREWKEVMISELNCASMLSENSSQVGKLSGSTENTVLQLSYSPVQA